MSDMTCILGIGGYTFDAASTLLCNGDIVASVEEERFSRLKHHSGMPNEAIRYCLDRAGISPRDLDYVTFCYKPGLRLAKRIPFQLSNIISHPWTSIRLTVHEINFVQNFLWELKSFSGGKTRTVFPGHHMCHAASSFFTSPFEEAAVLVMDQRGEWDSTFLAHARGNEIKKIATVSYPHSLGVFYATITQYLGFKPDADEYKVMGLAGYGKPSYLDAMRNFLRLDSKNFFRLDLSYLSYHLNRGFYGAPYVTAKFIETFGPPRKKGDSLTQRHMDIAASAQARLEEIVLELAGFLSQQTGCRNICIAGGVGLNGVANGRIIENGIFDNLFVPPVASDNGLGLGGALYVHHQLLGNPRRDALQRADWGTEYDNNSIEHVLSEAKLSYRRVDDAPSHAARLIAKGRIIGWFQGRMELGARALGFRSILADPTQSDMKDLINRYVKHREDFRPFAPAVLAEAMSQYFDFGGEIPFMTTVVPVRKEYHAKLPAITHVDGTARVQTVNPTNNPKFYALIRAFHEIKGVPIVLNTSFNVMNEPLVENPEQAVRTFYACGLDDLVIGDFWVSKHGFDLTD